MPSLRPIALLLAVAAVGLPARTQDDPLDPARAADAVARRLQEQAARIGDLQQRLEATSRTVGTEAGATLVLQLQLAEAQLQGGHFASARRRLDATAPGLRRAFGPDHQHTFAAERLRLDTWLLDEAYRDALADLPRLVALAQRVFGPDHGQVGELLRVGAALHLIAGDADGAAVAIENARMTAANGTAARRAVEFLALRLATLRNLPTTALAMAKELAVEVQLPGRAEFVRHEEMAALARCFATFARPAEATALLRPWLDEFASPLEWNADVRALRGLFAEQLLAQGEHSAAVGVDMATLTSLDATHHEAMPDRGARQRDQFAIEWHRCIGRLLRTTREHANAAPPESVLAATIAWKARSTRERDHDARLDRPAPSDRARLVARWSEVQSLLRLQVLAGATADGRGAELWRERQLLLQARTAAPVAPAPRHDSTTTAIVKAMAPGDALVEFVQWHDDRADRCTAFVLRPDRPLARIELGLARELDQAVASHLHLLARSLRPLDDTSHRLAEFAALRLRTLLLVPLEPALVACQRIWFATDGTLARLPFDSLPTGNAGTFLLEAVDARHLQRGSELLAPLPTSGEGLLVIDGGAIDLPEASREARTIAQEWERAGRGPALVRRAAAAAPLTADLQGRAFVHFATPGRFLRTELYESPSVATTAPAVSTAALGHLVDAAIDIHEVQPLDLSHCRLVLVSIADSPVGNTLPGDHLLSLHAVLRRAGAAAFVTVAWPTEERQARELMEEFWQGLLTNDEAGHALRQAKLAWLERNRRTLHQALPGTWASFRLDGR